ncbi:MAG: sugar transferase [Chloroflexota bacterium]
MGLRDTSESGMIFAPTNNRRMQLRVSERLLVMLFGDLLSVMLAVLAALAVWAYVGEIPYSAGFIASQGIWFVVLGILWAVLGYANGYYEFAIAANLWASLQRLILITLQLFVIYVFVFFLSEPETLPRLFILYYAFFSFFLLLFWRIFNPALIGWASAPRRVLIVGTDWAATTIIKILKAYATPAYQVVGVISETVTEQTHVGDVEIMGASHDLLDVIQSHNISELVITSTRELPGELFQAVMDAYEHGTVITPMPILYERVTERVPVEHVGDNWAVVLPINGTSVFNPYPFLKRLLDILMSLVGLLVFGLLFPFIALAIYLDSPGSIFYSQIRVGLNGKPFRIYKLRSMTPNAEKKTGAVFAQAGDKRVTKVGAIMRKSRLDELPQLWNVLRGDMSLIGPRPERPEHVKRLQDNIPFYRTRHIVRPGLSGWAQVRYGYGANDDDALVKLQYDLYYIRHQSLLMDFSILVRTVGKVLRLSGQ